jgi:hypothetical protein
VAVYGFLGVNLTALTIGTLIVTGWLINYLIELLPGAFPNANRATAIYPMSYVFRQLFVLGTILNIPLIP